VSLVAACFLTSVLSLGCSLRSVLDSALDASGPVVDLEVDDSSRLASLEAMDELDLEPEPVAAAAVAGAMGEGGGGDDPRASGENIEQERRTGLTDVS
jgi:hypothetical protein